MTEDTQENPTQETPKAEETKQEPEQTADMPLRDFLKHQAKAAEEVALAFDALIPPDFRSHSREAKKEFLMSFKVLVDGVSGLVDREVTRMREAQQKAGSGPSTTGKTKVKVEVS